MSMSTAEMMRRYCRKCYRPDDRALPDGPDCPILNLARRGITPSQWPGAGCAEYRLPPVARRPKAKPSGEQEELFAPVAHTGPLFVPVENWPDERAFRRRGGAA